MNSGYKFLLLFLFSLAFLPQTMAQPFINCPANIVKSNQLNQCYERVNFSTPGHGATCLPLVFTQTSGLASGSNFPVGTTVNEYLVRDNCNNTVSCSFTVTVVDNQNPILNCPPNQSCSADVNRCWKRVYFAPSFNDNCGVQNFSQTAGQPSGSFFPVGLNHQSFEVEDLTGNISICSFEINVIDDQEPSFFTCPADLTVNTGIGQCQQLVNWMTPGVVENCNYTVWKSHLPGSQFMAGKTNVLYIATDANGNTGSCGFDVTVCDNEPPVNTAGHIDFYIDCNLGQTVTIDAGDFYWDCGEVYQVSAVPSFFDCSMLGIHFVDLVVEDECGNRSSNRVSVAILNTQPLPVELLDFKGFTQENTNFLTWTTSSEKDNLRFEIEKSQDGIVFQNIGEIAGAINSNQTKKYQFIDDQINSDVNYYRLAMVDLSGEKTFSTKIKLSNQQAGYAFEINTIYPNPTSQNATILFTFNEDEQINYALYNSVGQMIYSENILAKKGENLLELNLQGFPTGIYTIALKANTKTIYKQISIQK